MRTLFHDAAVIEHHQPVHLRDCRQAMRNCDHGAPLHQRAETRLDRGLDFAVERGGRLVQHQNGRIFQDHARNRDALALTTREFHAAFANMRVIAAASFPVLQFHDEFMRVRDSGGRYDVGLARVGPPVTNIVAD